MPRDLTTGAGLAGNSHRYAFVRRTGQFSRVAGSDHMVGRPPDIGVPVPFGDGGREPIQPPQPPRRRRPDNDGLVVVQVTYHFQGQAGGGVGGVVEGMAQRGADIGDDVRRSWQAGQVALVEQGGLDEAGADYVDPDPMRCGLRRLRLSPTTACLVIVYGPCRGEGSRPARDAVLAIWPWPCLIMIG